MKNLISNTKVFRSVLPLSLSLLFSLVFQHISFAQTDIDLSVGIAAGYAPTLDYEESETNVLEGKGTILSIFGEVIINQKIIGRVQAVNLLKSTYSGALENSIKSSRSFTGSLGIVLGKKESRIKLPVMASMGAGLISYRQFTDGGFQIGVTTGPQIQITDKLHFVAEMRYLKGLTYGEESGPVSQTDFLIGVKLSL